MSPKIVKNTEPRKSEDELNSATNPFNIYIIL